LHTPEVFESCWRIMNSPARPHLPKLGNLSFADHSYGLSAGPVRPAPGASGLAGAVPLWCLCCAELGLTAPTPRPDEARRSAASAVSHNPRSRSNSGVLVLGCLGRHPGDSWQVRYLVHVSPWHCLAAPRTPDAVDRTRPIRCTPHRTRGEEQTSTAGVPNVVSFRFVEP
jgi:hypothetical protein